MKRFHRRFAKISLRTRDRAHAFRLRCSDETGQTLTEYALILALVAVAAVAALKLIGTDINGLLNTIATDLSQAT
jgi:Flp pilus assembly pilin Flp